MGLSAGIRCRGEQSVGGSITASKKKDPCTGQFQCRGRVDGWVDFDLTGAVEFAGLSVRLSELRGVKIEGQLLVLTTGQLDRPLLDFDLAVASVLNLDDVVRPHLAFGQLGR